MYAMAMAFLREIRLWATCLSKLPRKRLTLAGVERFSAPARSSAAMTAVSAGSLTG
jgi:hypothetical protein